MEIDLQHRWEDLTSFVSADKREKWWKRILLAYQNRPFRGLPHLATMFSQYDKYKDNLKERYGSAFAIFFKNIVYDPLSSDNASKCVTLLREFSQETTFDAENYVAELIEQSASSTDTLMTAEASGSEDSHFLMDFDMAWLADDNYGENEKGIRKEYPHLNDDEYKDQRLKVLKMFIQIPHIYATSQVRSALEEKARKNLTEEIKLLESGGRKY